MVLVIRRPQLAALQAVTGRDDRFLEWAVGHLRRSCPCETAGLDHQELRRRAAVGLARARRAGFHEPELVADFLALVVRHGPTFDEHPAVQRALARAIPRPLLLLTLPAAVDAAVWAELDRHSQRAWDS